MEDYKKIISPLDPNIILRVTPGHFVTPNSHVNYYIDMTGMKSRMSEANAVAEAVTRFYMATTAIDTILCMDGCEIIGAYLAEKLSRAGVMNMNAHKTIYITVPEFSSSEQMIFRENTKMMIKNKHILILLASDTTGRTVARTINTVRYYGGQIAGVCAIFSANDTVEDIPITHLFSPKDLPGGYKSYPHVGCPLCEKKIPIDAICNSYGYSRV
ncbi:MAG: phosphoribosyltransferase [Lachnospiraceae bacterium]|nr:phosphoribosyltransferase [Lachnospiraceae bacterium]